MNHPRQSVLLLAILAAFALSARAQHGPAVSVSGFGTGALTMADTGEAEFARPNQAGGAADSPRSGVDSNFGIQASAKFDNTFSVTTQGLVRKYARAHFGAELSLAFVKARISDDFTLRAGRIGLPVYLVSDFRNVGYANTMIRPPAEVYRQVNADYFDGADVVYQHSFDDTTVTAQFGAGRSKGRNVGGSEAVFKPVTALHVIAENGPFTLRLGRADARFDIVGSRELDGLVAGLNAYGLGAVAKQFKLSDIKGSFTSLGFGLDYKNFLVQSEFAKRETESRAVMDTTSWYAMLGYRIGKFTSYYYHGSIRQDSVRGFAGLPTSGPLAALAAGANYAAQAALQDADAVGLRWDFYQSAAFKLQVDRIRPKDGSGALVNVKPGFTGPVTVYAAGIDFVF